MSFEIGECRDFATGIFEARSHNLNPSYPSYTSDSYAVMRTEQRVWNGVRWQKATIPAETEALAEYYQQQIESRL